ncbi:class I SAM-dependent methyltransferase [Streptomyces niveus]|uniref:class I SAM-dependent methyltransferase n=1 Tax=Streptomyces niveus TaxID=193462 RepID=UPI003F5421DA
MLELACGTGQWTSVLVARAGSVTAVDAADEVLALARARTASDRVRFVRADIFEWRPARRYDTVFFAFWLSHVPPARLVGFWDTVAAALVPGGKVVFVDDGSRYRVVKVFHDPRALAGDLSALGWSVGVRTVGVAEPPVALVRGRAHHRSRRGSLSTATALLRTRPCEGFRWRISWTRSNRWSSSPSSGVPWRSTGTPARMYGTCRGSPFAGPTAGFRSGTASR